MNALNKLFKSLRLTTLNYFKNLFFIKIVFLFSYY